MRAHHAYPTITPDPNDPTRIKEGFHAGDHLHGSDAGYVAMAAAIQLSLLK